MAKTNNKKTNWKKKRIRTKRSLGVLGKYPRLVVFKSNKHIYSQLIDDINSKTILSSSTLDKKMVTKMKALNSKIEQSIAVGDDIADKIKENKIKKIIYDRNGYIYHGRVKALAEAIRKKGINF